MNKEKSLNKLIRELGIVAGMIGIPLSIVMFVYGSAYLYGTIIGISSVVITPWAFIFQMSKKSATYIVSFALINIIGIYSALYLSAEILGNFIFPYLIVVYFWSIYSEKTYQNSKNN
tara:strand:+ start:178 stop:528 length:351 start_codon:yes stop_codon:yes gene_type:complete